MGPCGAPASARPGLEPCGLRPAAGGRAHDRL